MRAPERFTGMAPAPPVWLSSLAIRATPSSSRVRVCAVCVQRRARQRPKRAACTCARRAEICEIYRACGRRGVLIFVRAESHAERRYGRVILTRVTCGLRRCAPAVCVTVCGLITVGRVCVHSCDFASPRRVHFLYTYTQPSKAILLKVMHARHPMHPVQAALTLELGHPFQVVGHRAVQGRHAVQQHLHEGEESGGAVPCAHEPPTRA